MTTSTIASSSKFTKVSENSIYNAEVGDCFNKSNSHVELITGMDYDSNGNLVNVEVSEQTPPMARTVNYFPSQVQNIINSGYTLLRYNGRYDVPEPIAPWPLGDNPNPNNPYTIVNDYPDDFYAYIASSGVAWRIIGNNNSNVEIMGNWYNTSDEYMFRIGSEMASGVNRIIPDGDYLICAARTTDKTTLYYLDIEGIEHPAPGLANVYLAGLLENDPPSYDAWTLSYNDGFYTIKQKGTEMCLEVAGGDPLQGENVRVCESNGTAAQRWAISLNWNDGYRIQAKCSGYSLDIDSGIIEDKRNVQQWESNDSGAQSWIFIPYKPRQELEDSTNVQVWDYGAESQYNSFDITKLENGFYKIIHAASGKSLDVSSAGAHYGTNIAVFTANGSLAQQWAILKDGDQDGYTIRPKCSGMALDVEDGKTENGSNIAQWPYCGTKTRHGNLSGLNIRYPMMQMAAARLLQVKKNITSQFCFSAARFL